MMNAARILFTLLLFPFFSSIIAQNNLESLIEQRDTLYKKQVDLENRNSNFWGTKSKRDLRRMVENLEEILRKDNEIIAAIKKENFTSRTNIIYKNRDTRSKNTELEAEINRYRRLNNQKTKELKAAIENLDIEKSRKLNYELVILVLFITTIGLLIYLRRLYSRVK